MMLTNALLAFIAAGVFASTGIKLGPVPRGVFAMVATVLFGVACVLFFRSVTDVVP